ncbi:hypothetical protein CASFOL_003390 [Castilleja foliolosa]|uniref:Uncharacterized protein n=1 Tax=Castilleja foliolosa TaxID=1961234 RepID=A0ABD3EKE9_9LAMI
MPKNANRYSKPRNTPPGPPSPRSQPKPPSSSSSSPRSQPKPPSSSSSSPLSLQKKKDRDFFEGIEMIQHVRLCELWRADLAPPTDLERLEYDFIKACPCDQCLPKLERLDEFEKEIQTKLELVNAYRARINDKEDLCLSICTSAQWSKDIFWFLNKKLKKLSEKLGVPCPPVRSNSANLLENVDKTIVKMLQEVGLLGNSSTGEYDENDDDILRKLETGRWYYRNTAAKVESYLCLENIQNLEKDWKDQKIDQTLKLVKQIECVEKLPVKKLQIEVEVLISQIFPVEFHKMREEKARDLIFKTSYSCIKKRNEFWQGRWLRGDSHALLKATLRSLLEEVGLFEKQWNTVFAPVFENQD